LVCFPRRGNKQTNDTQSTIRKEPQTTAALYKPNRALSPAARRPSRGARSGAERSGCCKGGHPPGQRNLFPVGNCRGGRNGLFLSLDMQNKKYTKNRKGRPTEHPPGLPIYESLSICSRATGIPMTTLKFAKRCGCDGIQRQRVDLGKLLAWLFSPERDTDGVDYSREYKKWQAENERLRYEQASGLVVERAAVEAANAAVMALLAAELDRNFACELPPAAKGLDEREIAKRAKAAIASFWGGVRAKLSQMYERA